MHDVIRPKGTVLMTDCCKLYGMLVLSLLTRVGCYGPFWPAEPEPPPTRNSKIWEKWFQKSKVL